MKKLLCLILVFKVLSCFLVHGASEKFFFTLDSSFKDKPYKYEVSFSFPENITIDFNDSQIDKSWSKEMPWIAAILIAVLTVGTNLLISWKSRKSNSIVTDKQIEQFNLNSQRDFNKTVLSGSRQLWISDFRNVISELLSLIEVCSFTQKLDSDNFHKLNLLINNAELMLSGKESSLELVKQLLYLKTCCSDIMMQKKEFDVLECKILNIKKLIVDILNQESDKAYRGTL